MMIVIETGASAIAVDRWDSLRADTYPFTRHAFLAALEQTGCVAPRAGWTPTFVCAYRDTTRHELLGAVPMYVKQHSYGEYVFDWAWAGAYARAGLRYYPKLIVAIPFTPATGPRILIAPTVAAAERNTITQALIAATRAEAQRREASSLHWLFTDEALAQTLEGAGYLRRTGCQFHWDNADYADFDAFLATFAAQKRKKIKRERRYVTDAGVSFDVLTGDAIEAHHWHTMYRFYRSTTQKHGAVAYLTEEFFLQIGRDMPEQVVLVLARHEDRYVAGALNFRSADTLYGRYWGCVEEFHSLHFETCYYQALEYCIAAKLRRFEAGAQGEHKLARGFLPAPTYSLHWLSHPELRDAVADFLVREQSGVEYYMSELNEHSPYKKDCP